MSPAPRVVLIADDDRVIGALLARIMQSHAITPTVVMNGADALAAAQQHGHELAAAFLDIQMPDMTGIDVAIAILQVMPHLPIVLMSGGIPAHLAPYVAQLPLAGFLHKPFQIHSVRNLLAQLGLIGPTP